MKEISLKTFAKINLTLKIIDRMKNGYHNLDSVFTSIDLADLINIKLYKKNEISKKEKEKYHNNVKIASNNKDLPSGESNIVYRIIELIKQKIRNNYYFEICINKNIPIGAGLGGGSANAAGVYLGLKRLINFKSIKEKDLAYKIGADVPFFIKGGAARIKGIGEKIEKIKSIGKVYIVLVNPGFQVSTKWVYKEYDKIKMKNKKKLANNLRAAGNDLEEIVFKKYKKLELVKSALIQSGSYKTQLSGSGPTVFGLFKDKNKAQRAVRYFINQGYWSKLAIPVKQGILFDKK